MSEGVPGCWLHKITIPQGWPKASQRQLYLVIIDNMDHGKPQEETGGLFHRKISSSEFQTPADRHLVVILGEGFCMKVPVNAALLWAPRSHTWSCASCNRYDRNIISHWKGKTNPQPKGRGVLLIRRHGGSKGIGLIDGHIWRSKCTRNNHLAHAQHFTRRAHGSCSSHGRPDFPWEVFTI